MIELLCMLAVWRLSSFLVTEPGPYDIFGKLRHLVGVRYDERSNCGGGFGGLFCCVWCMSVWVAAPIALAYAVFGGLSAFNGVVAWFAFSAGAVIVESVVSYGKG